MQKRIPAVLMRGGTSKGLFFHEKDLPPDPRLRDQAILAAYGSPDPYKRQIDGVGGALSVTSKVAIIKSMLEAIRCRAAVKLGIAASEEEATRRSQAVPKVAIVAAPKAYTALSGRSIESRGDFVPHRVG
jgi:2-methylaconitate cis-trans-isomerase PrpF